MSDALENIFDGFMSGSSGSALDIYRLEDFVIGGPNGRRLDPGKVEDMLARLSHGSTLRNACRGVGLSYPMIRDIVSLGEQMLDKMAVAEDEDVVELSEREKESLWLADRVLRATSNRQFLHELVVHESVRGNVELARGRFALDVLSRTDPENWDKKNKLPVRGVAQDEEAYAGQLVDGKTPREVLEEEQAVRKKRNEKVAALRREGTENRRREAPSE